MPMIDRVRTAMAELDHSRINQAASEIGARVVGDQPNRRRQTGAVVIRPEFNIQTVPEEYPIGDSTSMRQAA